MKPTPTQLALLMSAAGLSLSLPASASTYTDGSGRPNVALTFGAPARQERDCVPPAFFVLGSCRNLDGEYIGAAIGEHTPAASAVRAAQSRQSIDSTWSHAAYRAYNASLALRRDAPSTLDPVPPDSDPVALAQAHRAAALPPLGRPDDSPPPREALGQVQPGNVDVELPYDADAMAMVLMADPPSRSADPAVAESAPPGRLASRPQQWPAAPQQPALEALVWQRPGRPEIGLPLDGAWHDTKARRGNTVDPHADAPAPSVQSTFTVAESAEVGFADEAKDDRPAVSAGEAGGAASGGHAHPGSDASLHAGAFDGAGALGPSATEHVLIHLAGFVDAQIEGPAPAPVTAEAQAAALPQQDDVSSMPMAPPDAFAVAEPSASPKLVKTRHACAIERQETADGIVVASHADRVLMSLAALLSDDEPIAGRFGAQSSKTFVASHSEKVLQTLATFQPSKASKPVRAMAAAPAGLTQPQEVSANMAPDPPQVALRAATAGASSAGVANSLDAAHVAPRAPDAASPQAMDASTGTGIAATQEPLRRNPIGDNLVALSTEKLDEVRGGFVNEDGLKISFGIERAVYLNGNLVTTTSLNVADLSKISGGQAQVSTTGTGSLALVQSGQGNTFLPGSISQTSAGIVIQNTLDNQKIQTITRIDAVVNSSAIIRSMNLQSSMRSAVIDSLRR